MLDYAIINGQYSIANYLYRAGATVKNLDYMITLAFNRLLGLRRFYRSFYDAGIMLKYFIEKLKTPVRLRYLKIAARCGRFDIVMYLAEKALNHVCTYYIYKRLFQNN